MSAQLNFASFTMGELLTIESALEKQVDSQGVVDQETVDLWLRVTGEIETRKRYSEILSRKRKTRLRVVEERDTP